jgi:hypothetical protein
LSAKYKSFVGFFFFITKSWVHGLMHYVDYLEDNLID